MPTSTAITKVERTVGYGARVVLHGETYDDAALHAKELAAQEDLTPIHPFDDWDIIRGQGTVGLEIAAQIPDVGAVVLPIGGGGLIAGVALALKALRPAVSVIGVQAEGASPMVQSIREGERRVVENPRTFAEGIRVGKVGERTYDVVRALCDRTLTVSEAEIASAVVELLDKNKVVAEAAAAAPIAALMARRVRLDTKLCAVISGGNIDLTMVGRLIESGLSQRGTLQRFELESRTSRGPCGRSSKPSSRSAATSSTCATTGLAGRSRWVRSTSTCWWSSGARPPPAPSASASRPRASRFAEPRARGSAESRSAGRGMHAGSRDDLDTPGAAAAPHLARLPSLPGRLLGGGAGGRAAGEGRAKLTSCGGAEARRGLVSPAEFER